MSRRRLTTSLACLATGMLLYACGGPSGGAEQAASEDGTGDDAPAETGADGEELPVVTFGASGMPSSIGLLAALIDDNDIDADNGIDIQFSEFAPDQAEQAILTGQVDTGFFAVVALANVREEGQDVTFLRPLQANHSAVVVREDSEYESLEDLQGHTIATLTPVSGIYTSMQVLAAEIGLDFEADFDVISGPPPGLTGFIETGEVEAIVHFEPNVSSLLATGDYRTVMTPTEVWEEQTGAPLFMLGVAARESWVEANPEEAQALVAVFDEVLTLVEQDPDVMRDYQEELGLDDEAMDIAVERMADIYITESVEEIEDNVQQILQRSEELGVISEVPEDVFTDVNG